MHSGTAVDREFIIILPDGSSVLDWGNGLGVDLMTGETISIGQIPYTQAIGDEELEMLHRAGRVDSYDGRKVYIVSLPEPPHPSEE